MSAIQVQTTVESDGRLTIRGLPFKPGEAVQVSIQPLASLAQSNPYPLRGLPVEYIDPFEPAVPPDDWEVLHDHS